MIFVKVPYLGSKPSTLSNLIFGFDSFQDADKSSDPGKSEDIAKGILKGALDLQDSLSMIRKLQEEASQHTTLFGRKHTKKSERDRIDGSKIGRRQANPLGEQNYQT